MLSETTDTAAGTGFLNDTTLHTSKIIQSRDIKLDKSMERDRNCCMRFFYKFNAFIWQNEAALLKSDHLKAAPCISSKQLALLRILISVCLVVQTILTIAETNDSDSSFEFISQWNLSALTILFTTMAIV